MITPEEESEAYTKALMDEIINERPRCAGCGRAIFTEVEAVEYMPDGTAWHLHCYDGDDDE